jgi:hypothetical protein
MKKSRKGRKRTRVRVVVSIAGVAAIVVILALFIAYAHVTTPKAAGGASVLNAMCSRSNALFGIPNQTNFIKYGTTVGGKGPYPGLIELINCYYSLPLMQPVFSGTEETNITFNLTYPSSSIVSYPTGVNVNVFKFDNSGYADEFSSIFNTSEDRLIYYTKSGTIYSSYNISNNNVTAGMNTSGLVPTVFYSNETVISGKNFGQITFYPIYTNFIEYQLEAVYGNYSVVVNTYGLYGHYNTTYAKDIAIRELGIVSSSG